MTQLSSALAPESNPRGDGKPDSTGKAGPGRDAVAAFEALVASVNRRDFREARRRTAELRRHGWSVMPLERPEAGQ